MAYDIYKLIKVEIRGKVAYATIDNPPVNLITAELMGELTRLSAQLEADEDLLVVVLRSANPDFFLSHFDVNAILQFPVDAPARREDYFNAFFHDVCERFRLMNKVTIAQLEGRVGGGGSELSMSCDMCFGVRGKTFVNQMEVALGILPGGTGTQRLPRLIGRNRAVEVILGGADLDADTAERWGYLNRTFGPGQIGPYVEWLAHRIASFPAEAVRLAKQAIDSADKPIADGFRDESYLFQQLIRTEGGRRNMRKFLEIGGQTRDGELRIQELNGLLGGLD
ncbi:enoyl-CoA hydratase [Paraburkholderia phytofirmans OLGA172]|uniref:Enoyl-CoA hydratase n=1 Tax=Paraburkholderia phytofirmans OLGA172 TaxID=1417228 RepID=A0A160FIQ0_9BURK|nr:enoyl-CoA hydratase/isomerase family protein [Paraburkholderia phytofirmans]ANB72102.1 enoyl-CoA hydratase [Paraburkholderia phytofirmans OLGA172]